MTTRGAPLFYTLPALLLSYAFPALAQDSPASALEGKLIFRIDFPQDQPLDSRELHEILESEDVRLHHALFQEAVRASIQRLFRTGRFTDIKVNVEPAAGGVIVQYLTKNAWFVGDVSVQGKIPEPPNAGQIANASRIDLGTPFDPAMLKPAEDNILKLLQLNGFYEATVIHHLEYSDSAQQVNITFEIETGKRARYIDPAIVGSNLVLTTKKIIRATTWHRFLVPGWKPVSQKLTAQGVQNVRVRYEKANRLLAIVQLSKLDYDSDALRVRPSLAIAAGPKLQIKTIGAKIRKGKLKSNVPIYEEHAVDRDLLQEGANNLRDEFQASGFFEASVQYRESRAIGDIEEIDYEIALGERHRLVALAITGNNYFRLKTLRERMFLETRSLQFRHGRFSNAFLRRDKESISNLYRSNGFRDISITSEISDDYKGRKGDLGVTLKIDEGKQWIVSDLKVAGYQKLDLHRIISTLNSSEGQPFSDFNIAADREQILNYYFENGFPNAQFSWTSIPGSAPNVVNLSYTLQEGNQQFVRQVIYSGLNTTRPDLVNRQIHLVPGDPLSPVEMGETQRRLYDLGIFAKVDMAIQNPEGETERRYVLYDMEEASRWTITGGLGAQIARIGGSSAANDLSNPGGATGFSPSVELDANRINFMGRGQTLALRTRYSNIDKRGELTYLIPRLMGNLKRDLTITTLYDNSYDVRTFASKREEASVQLTERWSKPTTVFLRLTYRNVNVSNLKIDPLLIPLFSSATRTGIAAVNFINDRRDDPTDARRGVYSTIDAGLASHYLGGRNNFIRLLARNASYTRIKEKFIFARQTSFGILPTYGKAAVTSPQDPDPIPIAERFFGGGTDTLRAFPQNQAGPRDAITGFPLGGSALFFNNTELRFPLIGDNIGGVLFEDFGNVFSTPGDISFSFHQPHPTDPTDFNYMVHAAGFGVRYKTPIGPVRLDLAYSINPPKYNGYAGSFQDLVNCTASAQGCVSGLQQISHFQFFFSIGQTF